MQKLLVVFLIITIVLEGTLTSLPLVLVMLLITATQVRNNDIFLIGFLAGVMLDVLLVRPLGQTSVYFLIVLFLLSLYERKYEVSSALFVTLAAFVTSCIYFIIFPVPQSILQILTVTLLGFIGFNLLQQAKKRKIITSRL